MIILFKDTLKASDDFKNKKKTVWSNVFWYVKECIFWNCINYTILWVKTHMLKKVPSGKIKSTKKCPLFTFTSCNSSQFYFWFAILVWAKAQDFVSLKYCVGFSFFDSVSYLYFFNNMAGLFFLKRHNSFQN